MVSKSASKYLDSLFTSKRLVEADLKLGDEDEKPPGGNAVAPAPDVGKVDKDSENFQADVKKDPKTANISGQKKTAPGDLEDAESMKKGEVAVSDVIEKLNAIRAGHSLKDDEIARALEQYYMDLKPPERIALFAYLKGISEIIAGQKGAETAAVPTDPEPDIQMSKGNEPAKNDSGDTLASKHAAKHVTAKVEKGDKPTSSGGPVPTPITPKKR